MRITRIAGENIASLVEPFEIDFTKSPLKEVDIFAITGPTGSGKSSLLDTMCLALYDTAPRYESSLRKNDSYVDISGNLENPTSSKMLMHRGATHCYAETSFVIGTSSYTAHWELRRSRLKPDGKIQDPQMSLHNDDTGEFFPGTKSQIKERIEELIGLSYSQFIRSVLLAQGDFSAFLRAKDEEKGEILMKITDSDVYKRVSEKIFTLNKEQQKTYQSLVEQVNALSLPTEDDFNAIRQKIQELEVEENQKKLTREVYERDIKRFETFETLESRLNNAEENLERLRSAWSLLPKREEILRHAKAIRPLFLEKEKKDRIDSELKKLIEEQDKLEKRGENLAGDLQSLNNNLREKEEAFSLLLKEYEKIAPQRAKASELEIRIHKLDGELTQLKVRAEEEKSTEHQAAKELKSLRESFEDKNARICGLKAWFEGCKEASMLLREQSQSVALLSERLAKMNSDKEIVAVRRHKIDSDTARKTLVNEEILKNSQELQDLEKILPENIYTLRVQLIDGMPCPICGSTHHPSSGENLTSLGLSSEKLQALREEKKAQQEQLSATLRSLEQEIEVNKIRLDEISQNLETEFINVSPLFYNFMGEELSDSTDLGEASEKIKSFLELWREKNAEMERLVNFTQAEEKRLSASEMELYRLQDIVRETQAKILKTEEDRRGLLEEVKMLFSGRTLKEVEGEFNDRKERLQASVADLKSQNAETMATARGNAERLKILGLEIPEKTKLLHSLIFSFQEKLQQLSITEDELRQEPPFDIEKEEEAIRLLREEWKSSEAVAYERKKDKEGFFEANPDFVVPSSRDELMATLNDLKKRSVILERELKEIQETISDLHAKRRSFENTLSQANEIHEKLQQTEKNKDLWMRLNDLFGSADGKKFNIQAQGLTLSQLILFANEQLKHFAPRYRLQKVPKSLALEVIDRDMMEERRSVQSLSGGETFLVSLALSLALSEISAYNLHIESLFIDEGFGSLDEETLSTAMVALQRLNQTGRKVGIITHVESVTSRLPVRIAVKKRGNGESFVRIDTD